MNLCCNMVKYKLTQLIEMRPINSDHLQDLNDIADRNIAHLNLILRNTTNFHLQFCCVLAFRCCLRIRIAKEISSHDWFTLLTCVLEILMNYPKEQLKVPLCFYFEK